MTGQKIIKIGLDFDGVVTYNPLRIARLGVSFLKHKVLKIKKLGFFEPKNRWQRCVYYLGVVTPSIFPATGINLLKSLSKSPRYEFYLLTGRYGFTKDKTYRWLKRYNLVAVFKKIYINEKGEQPHLYKERVINSNRFNYFVEDNLDIVRDLNSRGVKTRILWIYNILDSSRKYPDKFPNLEKALENIAANENTG